MFRRFVRSLGRNLMKSIKSCRIISLCHHRSSWNLSHGTQTINEKMQNNVIVDVEKRFCSLWVIIRDDEVIYIAIREKISRFDFIYHFTLHGSHHETFDIFFLLVYVIPQHKNRCSGVKWCYKKDLINILRNSSHNKRHRVSLQR